MPENHGTPWSRSSDGTDSGAGSSGEVFDRKSHRRSRLEFDAGVSPWAGLQPDILGIVLRLLPCLADRASVRSVCRQWRAGASGHVLPPPLPLIVQPKFRFSSLSISGGLRLLRCVPIPAEVGADHIRFVGSSDGWLVAVTPSTDRREYYRDGDKDCFLLNVFSHAVVRLPRPGTVHRTVSTYSCKKTLPVINGSHNHKLYFRINGFNIMSFRQVVLSESPESGSKYIVAASFYYMAQQKIALWQPGMMSWHVCYGFGTGWRLDLAFYLGKLYVLERRFGRIYALELEHDDHGVTVSRVEQCVTDPVLPMCKKSSNMVVWRGNLLLIIRYYDSYTMRKVVKVDVFAVDFSTNPKGLTKIHNFDGDCIFVDSGGCKSFLGNLHEGFKGDHIYFLPDYISRYDSFVYNMKDGKMRPLHNFEERKLGLPVWLFPSDAA